MWKNDELETLEADPLEVDEEETDEDADDLDEPEPDVTDTAMVTETDQMITRQVEIL